MRIGIIGGGQLGRMLIESAKKYNLKFNVLEAETRNSICRLINIDGVEVNAIRGNLQCQGGVEVNTIRGDLQSQCSIRKIAEISDVLTYELEDINANTLIELESEGKLIIPNPKILQLIQNKIKQKNFYVENNIPTSKFMTISKYRQDEIEKTFEDQKFVVKSATGGYDGKGVTIYNKDDWDWFWEVKIGDYYNTHFIEEYIDCKKELACIVCRGISGKTVVYPVVEMVFNDQNVLDYQICPANINVDIEQTAQDIAINTIKKLKGVGVFAVEMFLNKDNQILVNEISPRVHNSGHHTIEACNVSQFEQLIKILCNQDPIEVELLKPSVMFNLLGPTNFTGSYCIINDITDPNVFIHDYGKQPSKPYRKMGHVTILDNTIESAISKYKTVKDTINIVKREPIVGVIMGSMSDMPVMEKAIELLKTFCIPHEVKIVSAHRTPEWMFEYSKSAQERGLQIIIAGAGGAAHLPGMTASLTHLPVIGVPVKSSNLSGLDSLYSIVQMPRGVPVATMAINGAENAALLAAKIIALNDRAIRLALEDYYQTIKESVHIQNQKS